MRIGVMGFGVVGSAVAYGFRKLGHEIYVYDVNAERVKLAERFGFSAAGIEDITECEFIFICVPTPCRQDGSCNLEYVEKAFWDLIN
ncbi:MAG: NAD(P)-binding domain-containing protein, partial [Deltaproteobacteria bacterium]|nr:NAD(P)-binding domain-containing protein [Deltaproteobacteria bacterium]